MFYGANIGQNCATRKYFGRKIALSAKFLRFTARARGRAYILKECAALLVWAGPRGLRERRKGKGLHFAEVGKMIWPGRGWRGRGGGGGLWFDFVEVAALQWV